MCASLLYTSGTVHNTVKRQKEKRKASLLRGSKAVSYMHKE